MSAEAAGPSREEVLSAERDIMDRWAAGYDRAPLGSSYVYRLERAAFADWVAAGLLDAGADPADAAVLDAGCGTGALMEMLARRGVGRLTGLDLSPEMLERGRARHLRQAEWIEGLIEEEPLPGRTFDAVTASFTLHHLHDPSSLFRLAARVLGPGGRIFLLEYDASVVTGSEAGSGGGGSGRPPLRSRARAAARAAFARKNRRVLDSLPRLSHEFNPAHRTLSFGEIRELAGAEWEVERVSSGFLRTALLYELVEESKLDRALARLAGWGDRLIVPRTGGVFQWIRARRKLL